MKRASLVIQSVKNLSVMQETWVRSLGGEDSLEKEMVTHASILAWEIPWTEETGRPWSMGCLVAAGQQHARLSSLVYNKLKSIK